MIDRPFSFFSAHRTSLILVFIVALSVVVYLPSLKGYFGGDDFPLIDDNAIESGTDLYTLFTDARLSARDNYYYRPLLRVSFALNYLTGHLDPFPYHLTNILLHATTSVLLFFLARRLIGDYGAAALAASVFAVHHGNSSVVHAINQRADILVTIFVVAGFMWYLKYLEAEDRGRRSLFLIGVLASFLLALFSKETALVFPALIVSHAVLNRPERGWHKLLRLSGFLAIPMGIYALLVGWTDAVTPFDLLRGSDGEGVSALPSLGFVALRNLLAYGGNIVLPVDSHWFIQFFSSFDSFPFGLQYPFLPLSIATLVLSGVVAVILALVLRRTSREFLFPVTWVLLGLIPALPVGTIAERRLYLPLVGFAILFALVVHRAEPFLRVKLGTSLPLSTAVVLVVALSFVSTLAKGSVHLTTDRLTQELLVAMESQHPRLPPYARVYATNDMDVTTEVPEPGFGAFRYLTLTLGAALRVIYDDPTLDGRVVSYSEFQRLRREPEADCCGHLFLLYTKDGRVVAIPPLGERSGVATGEGRRP